MAALNFPSTPSVDDKYTVGTTTWTWDGTAWNSSTLALIPSYGVSFFNGLDGSVGPRTLALVQSEMNNEGELTVANNGTGAATTFNSVAALSDVNTIGVASVNCGTTSTGRSFIGIASSDQIELGGGTVRTTCVLKLPNNLSDGTNGYFVRFGLLDTRNSGSVTDGLFFSYTDTVNSGNWSAEVVVGGSGSVIDTGITGEANTWATLEIEVNADASEAKFYYDGTVVHTETTTIPSGTSEATGAGVGLFKTIGTSSRNIHVDYFGISKEVSR